MKRLGIFVFGLVLLVALVGAVVLVGRNQDLRGKAYFAGSKLFLLPSDRVLKRDEVFPIQLWVETGDVIGGLGKAKVVAVTTYVCYDDRKLAVDESDLAKVVFPNKETSSFNEIQGLFLVVGNYPLGVNKCINLSVSSNKPEKDLSSGSVFVAKIMFKAVSPGVGGEIILDRTKSVVSGNATTVDTTMSIDSVKGFNYTIEGAGGPSPTSRPSVVPTNTPVVVVPTSTPRVVVPTNTPVVVAPTSTPRVVVPTNTPLVSGEWPILKYKLSYRDVDVNNKCVVNWPVVVTALAPDGTTKVYSGQRVVRDVSVVNKAVYYGELVLTDFPYRQGVAVFFKGPKHLQTKYGVNNQTGFYTLAGGSLILTSDINTTPVNDFSEYPLMPGDVTGPVGGVPDGIVDGLDYSYVKAAATNRDKVDDGQYLQADMDGNCQIDGMDTVYFKLTLKDKLEQLY